MRRSRFTDKEIIGVLREADAGAATGDLCRRHGISPETFFNGNALFGGMGVSDARQSRLAGAAPKKCLTLAARRETVHHVQERWGFSERRACRLMGIHRSVARYRRVGSETPELCQRLRTLAAERRRFGYRRLWVLLRREGFGVNHKRVYRLYREEGLSVRRRKRKRMAGIARVPTMAPERPNQRWSMDFVSDVLASGRRIRVLAVKQASNPESYPLTDKDKRQLARRRKVRILDRSTSHRLLRIY